MFILSHHNYHLLSMQLPKAENKVARPLYKDQMAIAMMNWESVMKITKKFTQLIYLYLDIAW